MKLDTRFEKNKLKSYLGKELYQLFKDYNVIIAGGLITSLFTNKEINDVDVYFRSEEDVAGFIDEIYDGHYIVSHTKKATLFVYGDVNVQTIHFDYFKTPQDIFNTFDFTINMGAFDFQDEEFHLHNDFLKHNSQKLLKFNKETAFPLISLTRVQKYEKRGYLISKPELFRIVMTCMNMEINSFEELKEQLGGMYGVNYDKLFDDIEDEEFSLDKAIDKIQNLSLDESYFEKPNPVNFNNKNDLLESICKLPFKYFKHNGGLYKLNYKGTLEYFCDRIPDDAIEIDAVEFFNKNKFYKYVKKTDDGRYVSFHSSDFEYKIGEIAEAKNPNYGLFFKEWKDRNNATYNGYNDGVLIEAEIKLEDFRGFKNGHINVNKCKVLREVPQEEDESFDDKSELVPF